jgi:hypothetical protein
VCRCFLCRTSSHGVFVGCGGSCQPGFVELPTAGDGAIAVLGFAVCAVFAKTGTNCFLLSVIVATYDVGESDLSDCQFNKTFDLKRPPGYGAKGGPFRKQGVSASS